MKRTLNILLECVLGAQLFYKEMVNFRKHTSLLMEPITIVFNLYNMYPLGRCREVLVEVGRRFNKPSTVFMYGEKEIYRVESIKSFLPLIFDPNKML